MARITAGQSIWYTILNGSSVISVRRLSKQTDLGDGTQSQKHYQQRW